MDIKQLLIACVLIAACGDSTLGPADDSGAPDTVVAQDGTPQSDQGQPDQGQPDQGQPDQGQPTDDGGLADGPTPDAVADTGADAGPVFGSSQCSDEYNDWTITVDAAGGCSMNCSATSETITCDVNGVCSGPSGTCTGVGSTPNGICRSAFRFGCYEPPPCPAMHMGCTTYATVAGPILSYPPTLSDNCVEVEQSQPFTIYGPFDQTPHRQTCGPIWSFANVPTSPGPHQFAIPQTGIYGFSTPGGELSIKVVPAP